jgi:hypothetical protein
VFRTELQKMGAPSNLPFVIPTSPTAKGVADAAFNTGRQYANKLIQEKTGLPFKLPPKLNAAEIGKSIGAVFPTDVESAMNTALTVGAQVATSALTSMLVGATVGSVVPGLGTVIGIGVAIGVNALKNLMQKSPVYRAIVSVAKYTPIGLSITVAGKILKPFSKLFGEKPPPSQVKCKTPWVCPTLPEGIDALGVVTWTTRQLDSPTARALRQEMGGTLSGGPTWAISGMRCGLGEAVACASFLRQLRGEAISFSLGTPATMGLPAVTATFNDFSKLPEDLDVYGNWKRFGDFPELMRQLQKRKADLEQFSATAKRVPTMSLAEIASFRFQVVTELTKAAVAVQNAQTAQAQAWLVEVAKILSAVEARRNALQQTMHAEQARRKKIGEARIKADPRGAEIATARAGCIIGHQPSCAKLKELEAKPAPKTVAVAKAVLQVPGTPPRVVAAAKRVVAKDILTDVKAPPKVVEAAKRVLVARRPEISAIVRAVRSSAKVDLFDQIFG